MWFCRSLLGALKWAYESSVDKRIKQGSDNPEGMLTLTSKHPSFIFRSQGSLSSQVSVKVARPNSKHAKVSCELKLLTT